MRACCLKSAQLDCNGNPSAWERLGAPQLPCNTERELLALLKEGEESQNQQGLDPMGKSSCNPELMDFSLRDKLSQLSQEFPTT